MKFDIAPAPAAVPQRDGSNANNANTGPLKDENGMIMKDPRKSMNRIDNQLMKALANTGKGKKKMDTILKNRQSVGVALAAPVQQMGVAFTNTAEGRKSLGMPGTSVDLNTGAVSGGGMDEAFRQSLMNVKNEDNVLEGKHQA